MNKFFHELRKRGVVRVAGLYVAVVWLLLQIADVVFPAFEIPDSAVRYILLAAVVGFPVVVLLAWFFEFTDKGLLREEDLQASGAHRVGGARYLVAPRGHTRAVRSAEAVRWSSRRSATRVSPGPGEWPRLRGKARV